MADVEETILPGVGVRHDFVTVQGDHLGVIAHTTGRRELLLYDHDDPDACSHVVPLEQDDTDTLAELLGTAHVRNRVTDLQQSVDGLTIDWLTVANGAACTSCTLADTGARPGGSALIVAVVRNGRTIPSPALDFQLSSGDVVVAVGTPEAIRALFSLLRGGVTP